MSLQLKIKDGFGLTPLPCTLPQQPLRPTYARTYAREYLTNTHFWSAEGHMQFVNCCRWAPDSSAVLSGSSDKTLRCWRLLKDGDPDMSKFEWGGGTVLNFAFAHCNASMQDDHQDSEDYHRLTLKHRTHLPDMRCILTTLLGHEGSVTSCEYSPDMLWIASTGTDKSARLWNAQLAIDPKTAVDSLAISMMGHSRAVISCAFSPNSELLATGSQDSTVRISYVQDGSLCERAEPPSHPIPSPFARDFSPNSAYIGVWSSSASRCPPPLQYGCTHLTFTPPLPFLGGKSARDQRGRLLLHCCWLFWAALRLLGG